MEYALITITCGTFLKWVYQSCPANIREAINSIGKIDISLIYLLAIFFLIA